MKEEDKARLLGRALSRRPVGGEHVVDRQKALAPFCEPDSVARVFCAGCGALMELDQEGAAKLTAGAPVGSFAGAWLECSRCICCDAAFKDVQTRRG